MTQQDLTEAYENGRYIKDAETYPPRWDASAAAYREALGARGLAQLDLAYGPSARARLDLFFPDGAAKGLVVFVHGGYWLAFDKSSWSDLAEGARAAGWAVAMPSYDLCPDVTIAQITQQVAQAVEAAAGRVGGPIRLTGHSAGGHLVARLAMPRVLSAPVARRVAAVVPISPLGDLRPLMQTAMNATLGLDQAQAVAESPALAPPPVMDVTVWVGANERPAFLDQARWLSQAWSCPMVVAPGRHHFDVIAPLGEPGSDLVRTLLNAQG
ncbi:alpha/beta hydrolase [Sagittula sp. SSi028]|uniref:alpha/beta hydrolase n=1 Tax=Sagittula sp. SSi028 TaxID=3400636 RepID=UPI003AF95036